MAWVNNNNNTSNTNNNINNNTTSNNNIINIINIININNISNININIDNILGYRGRCTESSRSLGRNHGGAGNWTAFGWTTNTEMR